MSATTIIIVIIGYFGLLLTISYFTSKGANNQSFFIGNKNSKWFIVSFGMIGASLSGVTFISVPGWVPKIQFTYMQMVLGYMLGYIAIAYILLPMYYKLRLTSIYTYLFTRFGNYSYKTGASFFILSRTIGASFRLYLMANVLQITVFNAWNVPFYITVIVTILFIWLYTFKGGIKTIIWTDTLQTLFMLIAVGASIYIISSKLNLNFENLLSSISNSNHAKIFEFENWKSSQHFFKQFLSGAFITIVMTGLDQDMMQKNLSCRNYKESKKNVLWYGFAFIPVNLVFLALGALLLIYGQKMGIPIPTEGDDIFPIFATQHLGSIVGIFFMVGILAAAYSSADSALTSLTTSFTIDILNGKKYEETKLKKLRKKVHIAFSIVILASILIFKIVNNDNVISSIFKAATYTYGPLLGLYAFGLFTKYKIKDKFVPYITILSPVLCYAVNCIVPILIKGFSFGYELLILNGGITFVLLYFIRKRA